VADEHDLPAASGAGAANLRELVAQMAHLGRNAQALLDDRRAPSSTSTAP